MNIPSSHRSDMEVFANLFKFDHLRSKYTPRVYWKKIQLIPESPDVQELTATTATSTTKPMTECDLLPLRSAEEN